MSAFKPSRHWGPRDPITHYYWRVRREQYHINNDPSAQSSIIYSGIQLEQFSGGPSIINISPINSKVKLTDWPGVKYDNKRRANSDDWLYTKFRKKCEDNHIDFKGRQRSRSLDWLSGLFPLRKQEGKLLNKSSSNLQYNSEMDYNNYAIQKHSTDTNSLNLNTTNHETSNSEIIEKSSEVIESKSMIVFKQPIETITFF